MQEFDSILVQKIEFCLNDRGQFKTMFKDIDLNMQIRGKYPVLMEILEESIDENYSIET